MSGGISFISGTPFEASILTSTTKSRMEKLEEQIALVNDKIAIEEYKEKNSLRKEQVIEYLTHQVRQSPKMILFALIQKIVLYDDKVEIYYNYIKNPYPDNFSPEIDRDSSFIECSIVLQSGAPNSIVRTQGNQGSYFFFTRDYFGVEISR